MSDEGKLPFDTDNKENSIWQGLGQDTFRRHIVELQRASDEVPSDPVVHFADQWGAHRTRNDSTDRVLPFDVERRLADDFASLAAHEESAQAVSAVALEEKTEPPGLIVRLAANETVPSNVRETFKKLLDLLSQCASRSTHKEGESTLHTS